MSHYNATTASFPTCNCLPFMNMSVFYLTLHRLCRFHMCVRLAANWHGFAYIQIAALPAALVWSSVLACEWWVYRLDSLDSPVVTNHTVSALRDLICKINLKASFMYFMYKFYGISQQDHSRYKQQRSVLAQCWRPTNVIKCCRSYDHLSSHNSGTTYVDVSGFPAVWYGCATWWITLIESFNVWYSVHFYCM